MSIMKSPELIPSLSKDLPKLYVFTFLFNFVSEATLNLLIRDIVYCCLFFKDASICHKAIHDSLLEKHTLFFNKFAPSMEFKDQVEKFSDQSSGLTSILEKFMVKSQETSLFPDIDTQVNKKENINRKYIPYLQVLPIKQPQVSEDIYEGDEPTLWQISERWKARNQKLINRKCLAGQSVNFRDPNWISPFKDETKTWETILSQNVSKKRRIDGPKIGSGMELVEF